MGITMISFNEMVILLAKEARNPDAIENGTNYAALEAILKVRPGFEWTVGTRTWRVA